MDKQYLDLILVPLGVLFLVAYHIWFLNRLLHQTTTTIMGINAANRRAWVESMMQDPLKNGILSVQTLRNNIMASTILATMAVMLGYVISVIMSHGWGARAFFHFQTVRFIYGNTSCAILTIKFFSILFCFLFNVQSIRYYSHSSMLITVPAKNRTGPHRITPEYVARALNKGSYFWALGLRALYFSLPMFLWIFGPIPMFVCCTIMVVVLHYLDIPHSDWRQIPTSSGGQPAAQGGGTSEDGNTWMNQAEEQTMHSRGNSSTVVVDVSF